jgi:hypothetical protein
MAAVVASTASLAAVMRAGAERPEVPGSDPLPDTDPLREMADACLDALAELARQEARTAALKARLTADYVEAVNA